MIAEIRALVATVLLQRARRILDEQAVAPLLSADIAGMIRDLDDRELLALCAPELRRRLGFAGVEAASFPRPARRERLFRSWRKLRRARRQRRIVDASRVLRRRAFIAEIAAIEAEPLPAPAGLEDLGPLEDLGEDDRPYVCPGCHAVASRCAPGCPEARMEREREERENLDPDEGDERETWPPDDDPPLSASMALEEIAVRVGDEPGLPRPRRLPELAPPIVLRPAPAAPPAHLQALPIEQLTGPEQRFKCVPFSAVIAASTCIERQGAAGGKWSRSSAGVAARGVANIVARCKDCDLGRSVAAQIRRAS